MRPATRKLSRRLAAASRRPGSSRASAAPLASTVRVRTGRSGASSTASSAQPESSTSPTSITPRRIIVSLSLGRACPCRSAAAPGPAHPWAPGSSPGPAADAPAPAAPASAPRRRRAPPGGRWSGHPAAPPEAAPLPPGRFGQRQGLLGMVAGRIAQRDAPPGGSELDAGPAQPGLEPEARLGVLECHPLQARRGPVPLDAAPAAGVEGQPRRDAEAPLVAAGLGQRHAGTLQDPHAGLDQGVPGLPGGALTLPTPGKFAGVARLEAHLRQPEGAPTRGQLALGGPAQLTQI